MSGPRDSIILAMSRSALPGVPGPLRVLPRPEVDEAAAARAAALAAWISWARAATLEMCPAWRTVVNEGEEDAIRVAVEVVAVAFAAMRRHIIGEDAAADE